MKRTYELLLELIQGISVINTHSHHLRDSEYSSFSLSKLFRQSYVDWADGFENTYESRKAYIDRNRCNTYFTWLEKSLQKIYGISTPLTIETWESFDDAINSAHKDKDFHMKILTERCRYSSVILDAYWNPGDNNNHRIFTPTYRINMFLYGYNREAKDHNGNNPLNIYGSEIDSLDGYISLIRKLIAEKKSKGCVALKSALAYDRTLYFTETSKEKAQTVFGKPSNLLTDTDIKAFQDYVFFEICKTAAELDLPLQCHTGLGRLENTNAMLMHEVICKNPDTKFVLFHCGYPWLDDINALLHSRRNVYPDLCWLPLISTSAAERMLGEMLDVGKLDRFCWGCDTWTSEESYGALMAIRHVLAKVLAEKVYWGHIDLDTAKKVINDLLYNNASRLYKI